MERGEIEVADQMMNAGSARKLTTLSTSDVAEKQSQESSIPWARKSTYNASRTRRSTIRTCHRRHRLPGMTESLGVTP